MHKILTFQTLFFTKQKKLNFIEMIENKLCNHLNFLLEM